MHPALCRKATCEVIFIVTLCLLLLTSCSREQGMLDPGGTPGSGVLVSEGPAPKDGRDVARTMSLLFNKSSTDELSLESVQLIASQGLELVEAFTVAIDEQIPCGAAIPPRLGDHEDPLLDDEIIANWESRVPLQESVIPADGVRQLVLVIHPEGPIGCLSAKGFSVTYRQFGFLHTVKSNFAMVIDTSGEEISNCESVTNWLLANPIPA